jgi:hypothetical protein
LLYPVFAAAFPTYRMRSTSFQCVYCSYETNIAFLCSSKPAPLRERIVQDGPHSGCEHVAVPHGAGYVHAVLIDPNLKFSVQKHAFFVFTFCPKNVFFN